MDFAFARITPGDEVLFGTDPRFTRPRPGTVLEVHPDATPPSLVVKDVASPRVYTNCWHESDPTIKQRAELFVVGGNFAQFRLSARTQRQWDQEDRLVSLGQDVVTLSDENAALRTDVDALMQMGLPPNITRVATKPKGRRKKVRLEITEGLDGDSPQAIKEAKEVIANRDAQIARDRATASKSAKPKPTDDPPVETQDTTTPETAEAIA